MDPSASQPAEHDPSWTTDDGLTACERAEAYGIDLSLLDENLRLTVSERLARNDAALALMQAMRGAKDRARP